MSYVNLVEDSYKRLCVCIDLVPDYERCPVHAVNVPKLEMERDNFKRERDMLLRIIERLAKIDLR